MAVPIEIDVWQGEIAELEVDAIIVPANESLFMTNPLARTVKRRCRRGRRARRGAAGPDPARHPRWSPVAATWPPRTSSMPSASAMS